ncbi:hypothetical protein GCM10029964_067150 [Kibdelosporangium lantanae]
MYAPDRGEQREVRADKPLLGGDLEQSRCSWVALFVHVVAEAGDEPVGGPLGPDDPQRERVPVFDRTIHCGQDIVQETAAVLRDTEKPRPATQQPGAQRALDGVGRRQVRQAGHDRRRGEPVVRQRGQHGLEDAGLPGLGRRWVASQNASSPNPTWPITSRARSWPNRVMVSGVDAPNAVGYSAGYSVGWSATVVRQPGA